MTRGDFYSNMLWTNDWFAYECNNRKFHTIRSMKPITGTTSVAFIWLYRLKVNCTWIIWMEHSRYHTARIRCRYIQHMHVYIDPFAIIKIYTIDCTHYCCITHSNTYIMFFFYLETDRLIINSAPFHSLTLCVRRVWVRVWESLSLSHSVCVCMYNIPFVRWIR